MGSPGLGDRAAPPLPRPSPPAPLSPARAESQSSKAQPERSKKELFVSDLRTRGFKVARERPGNPPPSPPGTRGWGGWGRWGWTRRLPPSTPSLIQLFSFNRPSFPSAPLFPANLLLLKGPRFPSPPGRRAGGSRINPPPGLSPFPSPAAPGLSLAGLCARARWGRGPSRPLPVYPVGIRPGAGTGEGEGGQAPLFKLVSFPRRRPRLGLLCEGVCPDRPTHPAPPSLGGWGRLLKGSEPGSGAWGLGPRRGLGVGQGFGVL